MKISCDLQFQNLNLEREIIPAITKKSRKISEQNIIILPENS